jgi:hypothetical protein
VLQDSGIKLSNVATDMLGEVLLSLHHTIFMIGGLWKTRSKLLRVSVGHACTIHGVGILQIRAPAFAVIGDQHSVAKIRSKLMLRICENEFISILTDEQRVVRTVDANPLPEEFTAMPVATGRKNHCAKGYQGQT